MMLNLVFSLHSAITEVGIRAVNLEPRSPLVFTPYMTKPAFDATRYTPPLINTELLVSY